VSFMESLLGGVPIQQMAGTAHCLSLARPVVRKSAPGRVQTILGSPLPAFSKIPTGIADSAPPSEEML
jgi:hypothetical protein